MNKLFMDFVADYLYGIFRLCSDHPATRNIRHRRHHQQITTRRALGPRDRLSEDALIFVRYLHACNHRLCPL